MPLPALTTIDCSLEDGLARVTLNQAERGNPIDGTFSPEMKRLADALAEDDAVRCVLITARGRFFSVGGDVKQFAAERAALPAIVRAWTSDLHAAIVRLVRMRAPVVAAVQGDVAGGAVSFVAAADIVYAADTVKFTGAFPMLGFSADSGSTVTLSQRMGFSRAKRFLLMSQSLGAREACESGLVDFVGPGDQMLAEAEKTARTFAAGATLAYGGIKQLMIKARGQGLESQMEDEAQTLAGIARSDDAWEGVRAFVEKRRPQFKGR